MIKKWYKRWYKRWIKREKWHSQFHVEALKRQLAPKSGIVCSVCGLVDNRTFIKVVSSCERCARYVCFRCECECRQDDMIHSVAMAVQLAKEAAEDYYRRQCSAPKRIDK
jgi:hypothetical protein